jgi:pyrroline-5-carboxylate reductase
MSESLPRVVVVGCGHMGLAIVRGLVGRSPAREVLAVETRPERRDHLAQFDGFALADELSIAAGDLVVLAIPPQQFEAFAREQRHRFAVDTPVVSVMAGLPAATIAEALGTTQVVRSIPNTPSEVFQGMTVYFAGAGVSEQTVAQGELLLCAVGKVLRVDSEALIDDATAFCGGGPAFVSYIVDAFCRFAVERGFTEPQGRSMAVQVFAGTAALIAHNSKPPLQLCEEVMTPNGTTERGIAVFTEVAVRNTIIAALTASADRSRELALLATGVRNPHD